MIVNNYRSKELSWLSFNARLLQEAERQEVPLIERIKFLGIYSNNLDEFFRVRVAILKRIAKDGKNPLMDGGHPADIVQEMQRIVIQQGRRFNTIYSKLLKELEHEGIFLLNEKQFNEEQGKFVRRFFRDKVRPKLVPMIISKDRDLPDLIDAAIYFAVELINTKEGKKEYALIDIPSSINRFVQLPGDGKNQYIALLDDVIRYELNDIFYMFDFDQVNAYTIKLTRDAEMDLEDDLSESYIEQIAMALEKRKDALPVRFICDKNIPEDFLKILLKKLNFSKEDVITEGGRYHNFKDFMGFPKLGRKDLVYPDLPPIPHKDVNPCQSFLSVLKEKDILFHFPYHSFLNFIDFLQEVSIDPKVKSIHITIYRLAKNSSVINALISAARNGKKVTAVLELQARFDEKANIHWANILKNEGVRVIYGVPGLKVHSKLCLVVRKEKRQNVNYACIGTGNFNEDSAKVFCDHLLLTAHKEITKEVASVFGFINRNYITSRYSHLLLSPFSLRHKFSQMLQNEIRNAQSGKPAYAYLKLNNLVDISIIKKLYRAKKAGVDIRLNVRGMFSLIPQFDKPSNKIHAIGMIDRFLEHSRVFIFCNNNKPKVYLSSADLMSRNLDRRTEVACPVYDENIKQELIDMFNIQWQDNCAARILDNSLSNKMKTVKGKKMVRSQLEFYNYLKEKSLKK